MGEALDSLDAVISWRAVNVTVLVWLAIFFGRTLRTGQMPLIERIARTSDPELPPPLCRYTRRLTAFWSAYFIVSASLSIAARLPLGWTGAVIWLGSIVLFVGEHRLRPYLFPGQSFPGLVQQLRDTWYVWRHRP